MNDQQWYYESNGEQAGPISWDRLMVGIKIGKVTTETRVWASHLSEWTKLGECIPGRTPSQLPLQDQKHADLPVRRSTKVITNKCPNCGVGIEFANVDTPTECPACGSECILTDNQTIRLIVQRDPSEGAAALLLAREAYALGNMKEAYGYANKVLELNPEHPDAWLLKGLSAGWLGSISDSRLEELYNGFHQCESHGSSQVVIEFGHEEAIKIVDAYINTWAEKLRRDGSDIRTEFEQSVMTAVITLKHIFMLHPSATLALAVYRLTNHPFVVYYRDELLKLQEDVVHWLKGNNVLYQEIKGNAKSGCLVFGLFFGLGTGTLIHFLHRI